MKIICPNVGEIDYQSCEQCSQKKILECPYTASYKEVILKEMEEEHKFPSVTSLLNGCRRQVYFSRTQEIPIDFELSKYIFRGYVFHKAMENYLKGEKEKEIKIALTDKLIISGRVDLIRDNSVIDFKSINTIVPKYIPYTSHVMQVALYTYGLEQEGYSIQKAVIEYYDSEMKMASVELKYDALPIEQAIKKVKSSYFDLQKAFETNIPPPIPQEEKWRCNSCFCKTICQRELLSNKLSESL